jgi:hypothetical protein
MNRSFIRQNPYVRNNMLIPANLDLELLIKENKPEGTKGKGITVDNLAYIMDTIIYNPHCSTKFLVC